MTGNEEIRYYPGRGRRVEIIERGIPSLCGTRARIRFSDGREEVVPEALLAYPVSERKKNASE